MNYEFGEIFDCRKNPKLEHFIIILGANRNNEVMYFKITSRVYTVFKDILSFFNDCINKKYNRFYYHFSKEKGKEELKSHGRLTDALFLDKNSHYNMCFDVDSMIIVNSEPKLIDNKVLDEYIKNKLVLYKDSLTNIDIYKLMGIIKYSDNISADNEKQLKRNFDLKKRKIKNWKN